MSDPLAPVHEDDPYYWDVPLDPDEFSAYEEWFFNGDVDDLQWWDAEVDHQWETR